MCWYRGNDVHIRKSRAAVDGGHIYHMNTTLAGNSQDVTAFHVPLWSLQHYLVYIHYKMEPRQYVPPRKFQHPPLLLHSSVREHQHQRQKTTDLTSFTLDQC